ncbi:hypothetical protein [Martelella endophytica]|uniref:Uncharacterized protein n=1 Tax=Martelella endophytica TaxID=1486262 RepID=A0A0D5LRE6_MAREN|nr:hypothetical protein [Martelella endophytica]AJY46500.1 hypothetical protein TM49_13745 [Martelella endophytica]
MRHLDTTLSDTLSAYAMQFAECTHTGCTMSPAETTRFVKSLTAMRKCARNIEQELAVHRLAEESRARGAILDIEASRKFGQLIADPEGKIVRPDFTGGRK